MRAITLNSFKTELNDWLGARFQPGLPDVEGGWEAWIQIDLVAYLNRSSGHQPEQMIDIRREVPNIYNNGNQRADLLLNSDVVKGDPSKATTHPPLIIELKAQSYRVTLAATKEGISNDYHKLHSSNIRAEYQNAHRVSIVAAIEPELAGWLSHNGFHKIASGQNVELYSLDVHQ